MTERIFVDLFSKTLKDVMQERGLSAATISKATGIPKSSLSEWLAGRKPKLDTSIVKLARFLGVSVEYLVTGEHPEKEILREIIGDSGDGFVSIHKGLYRIHVEKYSRSTRKRTDGGGE